MEYTASAEAEAAIKQVLDFLKANNIDFEIYRHPPLPTIEIALEYWKNITATHCKNLFMRNHKGNRHYLISFECHKELAIHTLEHKVKEGKLSFASPERMYRCLGLHPGSVSPLGLIHDMDIAQTADPKELFPNGHRVKFFIDRDLQSAQRVCFHPCDNTASVVVSHDGFMKFLALWGGEYEWIDIDPEEEQ
jgi:Ala-tRNA(Pro) deacylase